MQVGVTGVCRWVCAGGCVQVGGLVRVGACGCWCVCVCGCVWLDVAVGGCANVCGCRGALLFLACRQYPLVAGGTARLAPRGTPPEPSVGLTEHHTAVRSTSALSEN